MGEVEKVMKTESPMIGVAGCAVGAILGYQGAKAYAIPYTVGDKTHDLSDYLITLIGIAIMLWGFNRKSALMVGAGLGAILGSLFAYLPDLIGGS